MANKFNNYTVNVAKNLLKYIGKSNSKFPDFLKNPNEHSFFINETDPIEVSDLLHKTNVNEATDICGIPLKLVKMAAGKLKDNLVSIKETPNLHAQTIALYPFYHFLVKYLKNLSIQDYLTS